MKTIIAAGFALALAGGVLPATAGADTGTSTNIGTSAVTGTIIGGSALLDASSADQLGRWLGAGNIDLSNVYTLKPGDTSLDFHLAVDGKGPTFTLLEVNDTAGKDYLVGGYDPQSWSSTDGWHETPLDDERAAFLFNMTVPAVYRQVPATYELPSQGLRQTYNDGNVGPAFGSGPDLYVNDTLQRAISWQLSYGSPSDEGLSIVDRSRGQNVLVDAIEVFAVSPVPEPSQAALLLAGAGVLALCARSRRREGGAR
ncbi:MAG TPA: PEP_CTERM-anchored TLD domain-containing protein [Telluria sp.]